MFDWNQTPQSVTVAIPLSYKIDVRKVDSMITENFVKLNVPEMKIFKFIDLYEKIDLEASNVLIEDKKIIFYLNKASEGIWPQLEYKTSNKEELKERRKAAEDNYNTRIQMERETAKMKKTEFERFVLDKSIKIDEDKRKELKEKKTVERNEVERELYQFINDIENKGIKEDKGEIISPKIQEKEIINTEKETEYIKPTLTTTLASKSSPSNIQNSEIFDSNKLTETDSNKPKENPSEIRQQANIKVNLTEKMIPHFAARESLSKEPPYPKSKKYTPEKNMLGHEIEDRNPVWIKEKADNFFKNKDYRSAINAYNRSLE